MRLTTQSRYAVRAVFDIAYHGSGAPAQLHDIARRQRLSARYLEQIFQKLKRGGILGSRRGPRGGYFLRRSPAEITLYDILLQSEGPIELVFCVGEDGGHGDCGPPACDLRERCVASPLWKDVGGRLAEVFDATTVADLCRQAEGMGIERRSCS